MLNSRRTPKYRHISSEVSGEDLNHMYKSLLVFFFRSASSLVASTNCFMTVSSKYLLNKSSPVGLSSMENCGPTSHAGEKLSPSIKLLSFTLIGVADASSNCMYVWLCPLALPRPRPLPLD